MAGRILLSLSMVALAWLALAGQFSVQRLQGRLQTAELRLRAAEERVTTLELAVGREQDRVNQLRGMVREDRRTLQSMERRKELTVTAYSPRPQETDSTPFITASNSPVRPGIVAVSRDLFDAGWVFGRKVYIKGLGVYTIDDLMHERKTAQIDVFVYDAAEAQAFGSRTMEVYLLDM